MNESEFRYKETCTKCGKQIQNMAPGILTYVKNINNPDFCQCSQETKFIPKEFDMDEPIKDRENIVIHDSEEQARVDKYVAAMRINHPPLDVNQITLRDRIAMAFLGGVVSNHENMNIITNNIMNERISELKPCVVVSKLAYEYADAMLEARKK